MSLKKLILIKTTAFIRGWQIWPPCSRSRRSLRVWSVIGFQTADGLGVRVERMCARSWATACLHVWQMTIWKDARCFLIRFVVLPKALTRSSPELYNWIWWLLASLSGWCSNGHRTTQPPAFYSGFDSNEKIISAFLMTIDTIFKEIVIITNMFYNCLTIIFLGVTISCNSCNKRTTCFCFVFFSRKDRTPWVCLLGNRRPNHMK